MNLHIHYIVIEKQGSGIPFAGIAFLRRFVLLSGIDRTNYFNNIKKHPLWHLHYRRCPMHLMH
jgi:hypothetical protein